MVTSTYSRSPSTGIGSPASRASSRYSSIASSMFLRIPHEYRPATRNQAMRGPQLHTRRHFRAAESRYIPRRMHSRSGYLGHENHLVRKGKARWKANTSNSNSRNKSKQSLTGKLNSPSANIDAQTIKPCGTHRLFRFAEFPTLRCSFCKPNV